MITLGVIGVVAAMTMPVLIQEHKKHEISTSIKKFYTNMSQAILLSEIDNEFSGGWTYEGPAKDDDGNLDYTGQRDRALNFFNKYLASYLRYVKIDENPEELRNEDGNANQIKVYLADGTYFFLNNGECAHFTYDANGERKPNTGGRDQFSFLLCSTGNNTTNRFFGENYKSNFGPYCGEPACTTREIAKTKCISKPGYCGSLLMFDGWEFKSDYPHRL